MTDHARAIEADQRTHDWVIRFYGLLCMAVGGVIGFLVKGIMS